MEAWPFGPVVPEVYYYFCRAGAMPITLCSSEKVKVTLASEDKVIIDRLVETKRQLNPWDMVRETHRHGGAWESMYKGGYGNRSTIPISKIRSLG